MSTNSVLNGTVVVVSPHETKEDDIVSTIGFRAGLTRVNNQWLRSQEIIKHLRRRIEIGPEEPTSLLGADQIVSVIALMDRVNIKPRVRSNTTKNFTFEKVRDQCKAEYWIEDSITEDDIKKILCDAMDSVATWCSPTLSSGFLCPDGVYRHIGLETKSRGNGWADDIVVFNADNESMTARKKRNTDKLAKRHTPVRFTNQGTRRLSPRQYNVVKIMLDRNSRLRYDQPNTINGLVSMEATKERVNINTLFAMLRKDVIVRTPSSNQYVWRYAVTPIGVSAHKEVLAVVGVKL